MLQAARRGVAQPGSALDWGSSGRWFKSSHPDQRRDVRQRRPRRTIGGILNRVPPIFVYELLAVRAERSGSARTMPRERAPPQERLDEALRRAHQPCVIRSSPTMSQGVAAKESMRGRHPTIGGPGGASWAPVLGRGRRDDGRRSIDARGTTPVPARSPAKVHRAPRTGASRPARWRPRRSRPVDGRRGD